MTGRLRGVRFLLGFDGLGWLRGEQEELGGLKGLEFGRKGLGAIAEEDLTGGTEGFGWTGQILLIGMMGLTGLIEPIGQIESIGMTCR